MKQNKIISDLKEARKMYINLKEQHCPKSILTFWGNECLRLRKQVNSLNKFRCSEKSNNSNPTSVKIAQVQIKQ